MKPSEITLTEFLLGVVVAGPVLPQLVVGVHPVAVVVHVLKPHHPVVQVPRAVPGMQFNRRFEFWAQNWAPIWATFWAKFSTRALQDKTCLKTPNMAWARFWA